MRPPPVEPKRAVDFLRILHNLKATKRTGWVRKGVEGPESIADHMYRMSVMAMIAPDDAGGLDRDRCIKLAIVHDIAEALAGDIAPSDNVPKEEKHRLELEALTQMTATLGADTQAALEIGELWREYESGETEEARLLKDIDKIEMVLQALEYEDAQPGVDLTEFYAAVAGLRTETGRRWGEEILRRRQPRAE